MRSNSMPQTLQHTMRVFSACVLVGVLVASLFAPSLALAEESSASAKTGIYIYTVSPLDPSDPSYPVDTSQISINTTTYETTSTATQFAQTGDKLFIFSITVILCISFGVTLLMYARKKKKDHTYA